MLSNLAAWPSRQPERRDHIIGDLEAAEEELGHSVAALGEAFEMLATGSGGPT